ncbi:Serine palmitoyltransferase 2 [Tyrophagus putrescentiae]|nr:Serine palmitoyltransferase 2 [Tyrophagus putrescentiae]
MREQLKAAGFIITGHRDSPVIPIMVYFPSKVGSIARNSIYKGLAVVAAGYPATTLPTCRIRLCMSAAHSRATLDRAIAILSEMGDAHHIKYAQY